MPTCSIRGCRNTANHKFPRDPTLLKKWIAATGKAKWKPGITSGVCHRHFGHDDYPTLNYYGNKPAKRQLKVDAVPSKRCFGKTKLKSIHCSKEVDTQGEQDQEGQVDDQEVTSVLVNRPEESEKMSSSTVPRHASNVAQVRPMQIRPPASAQTTTLPGVIRLGNIGSVTSQKLATTGTTGQSVTSNKVLVASSQTNSSGNRPLYQLVNVNINGVIKNLLVPVQPTQTPQKVVVQCNGGTGQTMNIITSPNTNLIVQNSAQKKASENAKVVTTTASTTGVSIVLPQTTAPPNIVPREPMVITQGGKRVLVATTPISGASNLLRQAAVVASTKPTEATAGTTQKQIVIPMPGLQATSPSSLLKPILFQTTSKPGVPSQTFKIVPSLTGAPTLSPSTSGSHIIKVVPSTKPQVTTGSPRVMDSKLMHALVSPQSSSAPVTSIRLTNAQCPKVPASIPMTVNKPNVIVVHPATTRSPAKGPVQVVTLGNASRANAVSQVTSSTSTIPTAKIPVVIKPSPIPIPNLNLVSVVVTTTTSTSTTAVSGSTSGFTLNQIPVSLTTPATTYLSTSATSSLMSTSASPKQSTKINLMDLPEPDEDNPLMIRIDSVYSLSDNTDSCNQNNGSAEESSSAPSEASFDPNLIRGDDLQVRIAQQVVQQIVSQSNQSLVNPQAVWDNLSENGGQSLEADTVSGFVPPVVDSEVKASSDDQNTGSSSPTTEATPIVIEPTSDSPIDSLYTDCQTTLTEANDNINPAESETSVFVPTSHPAMSVPTSHPASTAPVSLLAVSTTSARPQQTDKTTAVGSKDVPNDNSDKDDILSDSYYTNLMKALFPPGTLDDESLPNTNVPSTVTQTPQLQSMTSIIIPQSVSSPSVPLPVEDVSNKKHTKKKKRRKRKFKPPFALPKKYRLLFPDIKPSSIQLVRLNLRGMRSVDVNTFVAPKITKKIIPRRKKKKVPTATLR